MTSYDATQAHTTNHAAGEAAADAVDALLAQPFANFHVDTTSETHQVRVTKKGAVLAHTSPREDTRRGRSATTTGPRTGCWPRTTRC